MQNVANFAEILRSQRSRSMYYLVLINLVDLVKSFPTNIYLQKSASIQPRTSPSKFGGNYSILFNRVLRSDTGRGRVGGEVGWCGSCRSRFMWLFHSEFIWTSETPLPHTHAHTQLTFNADSTIRPFLRTVLRRCIQAVYQQIHSSILL